MKSFDRDVCCDPLLSHSLSMVGEEYMVGYCFFVHCHNEPMYQQKAVNSGFSQGGRNLIQVSGKGWFWLNPGSRHLFNC